MEKRALLGKRYDLSNKINGQSITLYINIYIPHSLLQWFLFLPILFLKLNIFTYFGDFLYMTLLTLYQGLSGSPGSLGHPGPQGKVRFIVIILIKVTSHHWKVIGEISKCVLSLNPIALKLSQNLEKSMYRIRQSIYNFENFLNFVCFEGSLKTHSLRAASFDTLRFQSKYFYRFHLMNLQKTKC